MRYDSELDSPDYIVNLAILIFREKVTASADDVQTVRPGALFTFCKVLGVRTNVQTSKINRMDQSHKSVE